MTVYGEGADAPDRCPWPGLWNDVKDGKCEWPGYTNPPATRSAHGVIPKLPDDDVDEDTHQDDLALRYSGVLLSSSVVIMKKDRLGWAPQMTTPAAAESAAEWCSFGGGH